MDGQRKKCQRLEDMVKAADVVLFVKDNIFLLLLPQIPREIDPRPEKSDDEG